MTISHRQRKMLVSFATDGEATDLADFVSWVNRERVINALRRKGYLDDDGITDAGRVVIGLLGGFRDGH